MKMYYVMLTMNKRGNENVLCYVVSIFDTHRQAYSNVTYEQYVPNVI